MTERLQKLIARSGLCSRRAAEELLAAGRVRVNGEVAALGDRADPACDRIEVDGKPLAAAPELVYLMLNKPRGYVTTLADGGARRRRSWSPTATRGCFPSGGSTATARDCCL